MPDNVSQVSPALAQVAVYVDFDNIVMSRYDELHGYLAYRNDNAGKRQRSPAIARKVEEAHVELSAIIDYASSFGTVAVSRAYADWSVFGNSEYRDDLLKSSVDLVQMFPLTGSKNGADIRLAVDVMDDLARLSHITHVVIVAGDSDYMSLAQRCKRLGRTVIGVGAAKSVGQYFRAACDQFRYYGNLPSLSLAQAKTTSSSSSSSTTRREATPAQKASSVGAASAGGARLRDLLVRALTLMLSKADSEWVNGGTLKAQVVRLDPSFDESALGFKTFTAFLNSMPDVVESKIEDTVRMVRPVGAYAAEILGESVGADAPTSVPAVPVEVASPEAVAIRQVLGNGASFVLDGDWETACVQAAKKAMEVLAGEEHTMLVPLRERVIENLYPDPTTVSPTRRRAVINVFQLMPLTLRAESGTLIVNPELESAGDDELLSLLRENVASKARHKLYPDPATAEILAEALYGRKPATVGARQVFERVLALPTVQMMSETLRPVLLPSAVLWDVAEAVTNVPVTSAVGSIDLLATALKEPLAALERDVEEVPMNEVYAALTSAAVLRAGDDGTVRNAFFESEPHEVAAEILADWIRRLDAVGQAHPLEATWVDSLQRLVLMDRNQSTWRTWVREVATYALASA